MNNKNVAIDYLRAFIIVLLVPFHAVAGYVTFAPSAVKAFASEPYFWAMYPVVDHQRWAGFDLFVMFNDIFFMSLMFLLSGLFVWPSVSRRGRKGYLHARILRLGLPFVIAAVILAPLSYYPSYLLTGADPAAGAYVRKWLSLDYWPSGPVWFIAVLLMFDVLAVLFHKYLPGLGELLGRLSSGASSRPVRFFCGLIGISIVAYLTMVSIFGPYRWFTFGPFAIQSGRILLYPTYFFAGVGLGVWGLERGLLQNDGRLARHWAKWLGAAIAVFCFFIFLVIKIAAIGPGASLVLQVGAATTFALSCGASSFFFLAVFVRFAKRNTGIWDSLSTNAYGIYLIHYPFVSWIQYALLGADMSAVQKGLIASVAALLLSWGTVAAIRRIPVVGRVLGGGVRNGSASLA